MSIPATPYEVRFAQTEQRKFGKFVLPGTMDIAENVHQIKDGLYEKRDGYGNMDKTCDTGSITSASDLGLVSNRLAQLAEDAIRIRIGSQWVHTDRWKPAFASYRTAIAGAGFRPSKIVDSNGNTWFFSASQDVNSSTGSTDRNPVVRVEDANGKEVVPAREFSSVPINGGKPIRSGTKIFYYFHEANGGAFQVAVFDATSPSSAPAISTVYSPLGSMHGFDVRQYPETGAIVLMLWGNAINGGSTAVGTAVMNAATGAVSGAIVFTAFADGRQAYEAGCLCVNYLAGRGYFGAISHVGAIAGIDTIEAVEIDTTTLAPTFTQLTVADMSGVHQLGAIVNADDDLEVYWGNCRELMNPLTDMPPPSPQLWQFKLDPPTSTVTPDFITYGAWLAADPVIYNERVHLILGHESRFSEVRDPQLTPQRCYSLMDTSTFDVLARAMYEARGGDCDHRAGAGIGYVIGSFNPPASASGDTISACVSWNHDGLNGFSTVDLTFDLAPALGPRIHIDDGMILPGGFPRFVGPWLKSVDLAPQFFPEYVDASDETSGVGFPSYDGTWTACATYVIRWPDGREIESQASTTSTVTTAGGTQYLRVIVPTAKQHGTDDSEAKTFVRVYVNPAGTTTLQRQAEMPNRTDVDTLTFHLSSIGVGPNLYTEGGVVENTAPPPFKYGFRWDDRVFVGGCAEAGNIYHTKLIQREKLPQFVADFRFYLGAEDFAGGAVDRNYAAFFHADGISVIASGGPSDVGGENYRARKLEDVSQTCDNPSSCVTTSRGLVFQGKDKGIYLLDRSLSVLYVGRGVHDRVAGHDVTSAEWVVGQRNGVDSQQARLTLDNGDVLVFDMMRTPAVQQAVEDTIGTWYVWPVEDLNPVGAVIKDGVHHILGSDGTVWNQVADQAFDATDTFIPMKVSLPLTFQGIAAYLRCLRGVLLSYFVGPHVLQLSLERDGTSTPFNPKTIDSVIDRCDFRPNPSKASHFLLTIEEQQHESELNKGFKLEGLAFEIQRQPGIARGQTRTS